MAGSTAFWAPVHRVLRRVGASQPNAVPGSAAPSIDFAGSGIQDHRLSYNRANSITGAGVVGWYGSGVVMTANYVPSTIAVANIAAAANAASGVAVTLVASSGAGAIKLSTTAPAFFLPTLRTVTAGIAIDSLPTFNAFGATLGNFVTALYSRQTLVGRAVSITGVASGTGGNLTVAGYDCYGYPMTEVIAAGAGVSTVNGKKAFKVITSVTPAFTDAHTYSVGTADIFGFGLLAANFVDIRVIWNNAVTTANTGFVAADTTSPATTTTGDVRGTYAVQSASDGTKRLGLFVTPSVSSLLTNFTTGLFGQPQV